MGSEALADYWEGSSSNSWWSGNSSVETVASSSSVSTDTTSLSDLWNLGFSYGNAIGSDLFVTCVIIVILVIVCKTIR